MLARTASNLYWIGRLMERAEFTARLVEATIRLNALGDHGRASQAWKSALAVVGAREAFRATGESLTALNARRYLTLAAANPGSIRSCIAVARDNARAARIALSVEVWEAINRAWLLIRDRASPGGAQAALNLLDNLKAEIRGYEGALNRMLHSQGGWFVHLGAAVERGDNTARLIDVKYYLCAAGADGRRRAGPRPVDDDPADRLGPHRLSPHLSRGAEALAGRRFPDLPRRDAALAPGLGAGDGADPRRVRLP